MQTEPAISRSRLAPVTRTGLRQILPAALLTLGLVLTVLWVSVLGYGLVRLIEMTY